MNVLHLRYAVEVEKTGSITLAAENLYMRQPNLSKSIKELELTLGFQIFKRSPQGVVPTKKGSEFLSYAKTIIQQIDKMESLYSNDLKNKISFSISIPRSSYISQAFTDFLNSLDATKELDINLAETSSMNTISNVISGEYNLGIIRYARQYEKYFLHLLEEKSISYSTISEFECLVLMSKDNQFAYNDKILFKDLNHCIELLHGDANVPTLSSLDLKKEQEQCNTRRKIYIYERGSQLDVLSLVKDTYMLVSPLTQKMLNRYNLVQRKCEIANNSYKDLFIHNKDYKLSDIDRHFLNVLRSVWDDISKIVYF